MGKTAFEFFQLRCFLAVAEELNFRRAATRMNMTQPPLSRQIRLLEEGIGLTLLERDNRSVRLTPAGRSFRESASDLLSRSQHAILSARQAERGEAGTVTMGFVPSAALDFVPRIVSLLRREMPGVRFDPTEMMSYEIVEALMSGRADLGLTRTSGQNREIESIRVLQEPFVLVMPADHRFVAEAVVTLEDLDRVPFVGFSVERGGFLRDIHTALFASAGIMPDIVQEVSQSHTVLSLVNVGLGVALVPRSAMAMKMDNLRWRPIDLPEQFRSTIYLNIAPNRGTALHRNVRDKVLEAFRGVEGNELGGN